MGNDEETNSRLYLLEQLQAKTASVFSDVGNDGAVRSHQRLSLPASNMVRLQRALSWLLRADELEHRDPDVVFIMHWIAFESLYGSDEEIYPQAKSETSSLQRIMDFIHSLDIVEELRMRMVDAVSKVWPNVTSLFQNQFVNPECWHSYYKGSTRAGRKHDPFSIEAPLLRQSVLQDHNQFDKLLKEMFSRLYLLRNQLFHGNASYKGNVESSRSAQINHGSAVMYELIPVLIWIMLDMLEHNPDKESWGKVPYPRILTSSDKQKG